jgi:hypothetical protein
VFPNVPAATEPDPPEEVVAQEERELANLQGRTDIGEVEPAQLAKLDEGKGFSASTFA